MQTGVDREEDRGAQAPLTTLDHQGSRNGVVNEEMGSRSQSERVSGLSEIEQLGLRFSHRIKGQHVYGGLVLPDSIPPHLLEALPDFHIQEDDHIIAGFPKSGKL